jgi:hypothetical protein
MKTFVNINIEVREISTQPKAQKVEIPFDAKIKFFHEEELGYMIIAFAINGKLYRPQLKEIRKIQKIYGVRGYKAVAEYMKGETIEVVRLY